MRLQYAQKCSRFEDLAKLVGETTESVPNLVQIEQIQWLLQRVIGQALGQLEALVFLSMLLGQDLSLVHLYSLNPECYMV